MARREFLQLADTYNPAKHKIAGRYISEKLDGTRCLWDGGLSRGLPTDEVPWASVTDPKTGKWKEKIKPFATGLWSRYGNPIMAPDWFLDQLPLCILDGELWAGRGKFQLCRSICGGDEPDPRFNQIRYAVYSAPPITALGADGEIKNANMLATVRRADVAEWVTLRLVAMDREFRLCMAGSFEEELALLHQNVPAGDVHGDSPCFVLEQARLPDDEEAARIAADEFLGRVLDQGGEGCVLRDPSAPWVPKRHKGLLKHKPYIDSEAVVVGFTSGRETAKGSRLLGRIGALIVDYQGKRLELAGLTDAEREFETAAMSAAAAKSPGADCPPGFQGKHFKVGQTVTFLYRELTDEGVPREARYFRKRGAE